MIDAILAMQPAQSGLEPATANDNNYEKCIKLIEANRVHLFDICTQYKAVFTDDSTTNFVANDAASIGTRSSFAAATSAILSAWLLRKIDVSIRFGYAQILNGFQQFFLHLDTLLAAGNCMDRLDSILSHCMYFGASFARLGCDFRASHLIPMIERRALITTITSWQAAESGYVVDSFLFTHSLITSLSNVDHLRQALKSSTRVNPGEKQEVGDSTDVAPPLALLRYTPLAVYANALVASLNDLRSCAPITLVSMVVDAVNASLAKVATTIAEDLWVLLLVKEPHCRPDSDSELALVADLFTAHLVPYISACLRHVFPLAAVAGALGMSQLKVDEEYTVDKMNTIHLQMCLCRNSSHSRATNTLASWRSSLNHQRPMSM